jgi:hypothetical protein
VYRGWGVAEVDFLLSNRAAWSDIAFSKTTFVVEEREILPRFNLKIKLYTSQLPLGSHPSIQL